MGRYHRHASGQIYALSRSLVQYISINRWVLVCSITDCLGHLFCTCISYVRTSAGHPARCCGDFLVFIMRLPCSAFLKEYKNEDVAVGAWLLGLDTELVDDRNLCCAFNTGLFLT